jgi:ubiquinone/menaquinone biosynthesis C-methylase UbiE
MYYDIFKEKEKVSKELNFYESDFFSKFYFNLVSTYDYQHIVDRIQVKNDISILEVCSGTAPLLSILYDKNPKMTFYGMDLSVKLIERTRAELKKFNIVANVLNIDEYPNVKFNYIIIPATSISLFNRLEVVELFKNIFTKLEKGGKIIFDCVDHDSKKNVYDGKINITKLGDNKFFYANYLIEDSVFLNVYGQNSNSNESYITYSHKYIHQDDDLKFLLSQIGFSKIAIRKHHTIVTIEGEK